MPNDMWLASGYIYSLSRLLKNPFSGGSSVGPKGTVGEFAMQKIPKVWRGATDIYQCLSLMQNRIDA